jgi:hypothetical protein
MSDLFKGNFSSDYFKAYHLGKKRVVFVREKIDANDFKRKKNEYDSKIQVAKTVLALNSNYEDCFLFEKIITDIRTSFSVS